MNLFAALRQRRQPAQGFGQTKVAPEADVTVPGTTLAERSRSQNPARMSLSTPLKGRLQADLHQTFILEPILTPSGLVDVGEDAPDMADLNLDFGEEGDFDEGFDPVDTDLPDGDDLTDGELEDISFIDNLAVEFQFESGYFTVGESGEVTIDYLFDGGGYEGELAIFSLEGMELLEPGSEAFIQMAADRALSESEMGYIVISDKAEGARFSGALGEQDWNRGDYLGAKTFQMKAGERFSFMLVPNGEVAEVANNPGISGAKTPLFSLATANPDDMFATGQIADATGSGKVFVFEDMRVDKASDEDYNDLIFQVTGAYAEAVLLDDVLDADVDWRDTDMGHQILAYADASLEFNEAAENQPLIGIIDTGFNDSNPDIDHSRIILGRDLVDGDNNPLFQDGEGNEHGTHILGLIGATRDNGIGIDGINDDAPIWLGRAVGSGRWAESLTEFVDTAKESGQPNAVVNLSFDLTQIDAEGNVSTRYELTPAEREALEYARQNGVLVVVAAGNDGGTMSALGQASQEFDNLITVGASNDYGSKADYSSFGYGLDLMAMGGSVATPMLSTVGDGDFVQELLEEEEVPDDEMTVNLIQTFEEVFGPADEAEDFDESDLDNLSPEESEAYEEATQAIDRALEDYLTAASQKLGMEYIDGLYGLQVDALDQFINAFDEDAADILVKAEELLTESGFEAEPESEEGEDAFLPLNFGIGTMAGTSVAAAKVTGAVSQVWAANPGLNFAQVKEILKQTALDLDTEGWDTETGEGLINLAAAVSLAKQTVPETYQPVPIASPTTWSGEGEFIPGERAVAVAVPPFTGRVMNAGYVTSVGFQRVRSGPGTGFSQVGIRYPGTSVTFDAYENNGGYVPEPFVGSSRRWYKIAGTNHWMWAGYIDNSPEQAEQERKRQEEIRRAQEEARRAEEELRRAEEEAKRIEEDLKKAEAIRRLREKQQELLKQAALQLDNAPLKSTISLQSIFATPSLAKKSTPEWNSDSNKLQRHFEYEFLAKKESYNDHNEGDIVHGGYKVDKVFRSVNGLYAIGLVKEDKPPVLVFRGTEPTTFQDLITDVDIRGVGTGQFNSAVLQGVDLWMRDKGNGNTTVIGHSLGGALAQYTSLHYSPLVNETVTFNSPGINKFFLGKEHSGNVTHYVNEDDLVSYAGYSFLPGNIYSVDNRSNNPLDNHLDLILSDPNTECIALEDVGDRGFWERAGKISKRLGIEGLRSGVGKFLVPQPLLNDLPDVGIYLYEETNRRVRQGIESTANSFDALSESTLDALRAAKEKAEAAKAKAKAIYNTAKNTVQQAEVAYQSFKQEVQRRTTQVVQQAKQKMQVAAQAAYQTARSRAAAVAGKVASYAHKAVRAVGNIINGAKQFVSNAIETGKRIVSNVVQGVKQAYNTVKTTVTRAYETGKRAVTQTFNNAANTVKNTFSSGWGGLKSAFGW